jgi:mono/diheme cytochrome c family protein
LFVNGISSGRVAYAGPFFAPSRTSRFRVGYVGNGYGSIQFDVSELAVYRRCLSRTEVFSRVAPLVSAADPGVVALTQAGHLFSSGRLADAESLLRQLCDKPLPAEVHDRALLLLGQCCRERGAVAEAREILEPLQRGSLISDVQRQASLEFLALSNDYRQPNSMERRRESTADTVDLRDAIAESPAWQKAVQQFVAEVTQDESREWKRLFEEQIQPVLQSACYSCHTGDAEFNSLDLTQFRAGEDAAEASSSFWKMLGDRVARGEMPPPTASIPLSSDARAALLRWINSAPAQGLCEELSADNDQPRFLEEERWFTGTGVGRRLTRLELRNSLRLLLGETLLDSELPAPEPAGGEGFDTAAGTVTTSSSLIEFLVDSIGALVDRRVSREAETGFPEARRVLPENFLEVRSLNAESQLLAARNALSRFSGLAWRRPWTDREQQRLLKLYELVRADGGAFEAAIGESIKAILLSPNFLFVTESEPSQRGSYRISSHELATRMSLFLWSSLPDEQLLQAADTGRLETPADLRRQITRMLADEKAGALGEGFGLQWLGLQRLEYLKKDTQLYPEFSAELLADFREEALQLVSYILRNNRPLHELVDAEYVIVNDRLAAHYGLTFPAEAGWQKISVAGAARGGILALGGTLAATSFPGRTSPVLRGRWILEEILGQRIQPPPPGIPALVTVTEDGRPRSMREQLEAHRSQPGCRSCHETMDQLGFSLEKFDPLGRMREEDRGLQIDDSARLPEGTEFRGISGLRTVVLERRDEFAENLCRRLAGYAFCRSLDRFDDCVIDRCLDKLKQNEWRSGVVLEEIILSYPFRHRFAPGNEGAVKSASVER